MKKVAPSLLSLDFSNPIEDLKRVDKASIYHYDVMDGHFVKNISFGAGVLKSLRHLLKGKVSTHLMISDPLAYFQDFINSGSDALTFHLEIDYKEEEISALLKEIRRQVPVGLSIKPGTDPIELIPYLKELDHVLIMSVEPGWGGQAFLESAYQKVEFLNDYRTKHNLNFLIEVDGGVNDLNGKKLLDKGANILVMGSFLFKNQDPNQIIEAIEE